MSDTDLIDLIDENDFAIGLVSRKEMRSKNLLHRVCHFFVFNKSGDIFITKRSPKKDYSPGLWEIGQGGVLNAGESYLESAKRELFEELGLDENLDFLFMTKFLGDKTRFVCAIYSLSTTKKPRFNDGEVIEGKFISFDDLLSLISSSPDQFTKDSLALYQEFRGKVTQTNCKSGVV